MCILVESISRCTEEKYMQSAELKIWYIVIV